MVGKFKNMRTYRLELSEEQLNAVLIALGSAAWNTRETSAYATYDVAYKEISRQKESYLKRLRK